MQYNRNTPMLSTGAGSSAFVQSWLHNHHDWQSSRPAEVVSYLNEIYRLAPLVGLNPDILVAQSMVETTDPNTGVPWTSAHWSNELNPAGLGDFDDGTSQGIHFGSGTDAARAQIAHMCAYVVGHIPASGNDFPDWFVALDPRYQAVHDAGFADSVHVIGDLGSGKWATDPTYASQIVAKASMFQGAQPMASDLHFGGVLYPAVIQSHLPADNPWVKTSGAPDLPDAVIWHRMLGTFRGTDDYFHQGNAATCYGVACAATDAASDVGKIFEWIAPRTGWYGESSGPVASPYGDGLALVNKVGINSVNRVSKAIEISGEYNTPLDEGARAAVVNMTAYWADQKHIPWDQFPIVPDENRSFVVWHQEITIGTGKICPGPVVMNETPALIQRVKDVLKASQTKSTAPTPTDYEASHLPDWWGTALAQSHPTDAITDGVRYWAIRRNFGVKKPTRRLSAPQKDAKESGPMVQTTDKIFSERQVVTDATYIVSNDGHFITASRLNPAVTLKPR